jgi:UDP-N-acetylmuramoyl-tripeptide--D-alanyl-D-alanine ligase
VVSVIEVELSDGTLLLDAHTETTFEGVRAAQRKLAELRVDGYDTVHVAGLIEGVDVAEQLDVLGIMSVRLNVHHLIVVGESARRMHQTAEQEGSWGGESIPVFGVDHAYDEVVNLRGPRVAILVTGGVDEDLGEVVQRLKGDWP